MSMGCIAMESNTKGGCLYKQKGLISVSELSQEELRIELIQVKCVVTASYADLKQELQALKSEQHDCKKTLLYIGGGIMALQLIQLGFLWG